MRQSARAQYINKTRVVKIQIALCHPSKCTHSITITEMSSSRASGTRSIEMPLPRLGSSDKQVVLPFDMILYIARYMDIVDYKNFVRALWPNKRGRYDPAVETKLWQLTTHRFTMLFINRKPLEIEYNFDRSRTSDPVLINTEFLIPVFGQILPPRKEQFLSVTILKHFVDTNVHLNQCSRFQYASCPCGENVDNQTARAFVKPQMVTCEKRHFHHYCSHHVNYWLDKLVSSISCIVRVGSIDKDAIEDFIPFIDTKVFFRGSEMQIIDSLFYSTLMQPRRSFINGGNSNA